MGWNTVTDKHKAYYIKTEDGAAYFEVTDAGYTFDIPVEYQLEEGGVFIVDDMCECYMMPIDEDEPDERVFVALKGNDVIAVGIEMDEDFNGEIMYATRLTIKEPKH